MTDYVALQPITTASGALAHNPGDPVPAANVEQQGYVVGEQVAEAGSAEADEALRALGIIPSSGPTGVTRADLAAGAEAAEAGGSGGVFDPADHTVDQVNDHLAEHPDEVGRVLRAEAEGKHRSGIVHGPHGTSPDVAES